MVKIIRQTWRGCWDLPYVGSHPGTLIVFIMIVSGAIAGGVAGALIMTIFFGPMYLFGAYGRANCSDTMVGEGKGL